MRKMWKVLALYVLVMWVLVIGMVWAVTTTIERAGGVRCIVYAVWEGKAPEGCPR